MVFLTSLQSIIPIVLLISLGYILKGRGMFHPIFSGNLSRFIMSVALPAGVFVSVLHHLHTSDLWNLRYGMLAVTLTYVIAYIVAFIMMKVLKVPRGRRGIFINMVVNDNCLFIGLPVQIALFGQDALPYFLLYYIGNTISVWMVGVFLIELDPLPNAELGFNNNKADGISNSKVATETKRKQFKFDLKKLLPPPLLGFFVALIFLFFEIPLAPILHTTLNYLGDMVTPLSLIYIGIVLCDAGLKNFKVERDTILGLIGRFILSPLVLILLIKFVAPAAGIHMVSLMRETFIVQAATPALAVLPILANEAHGDVKYATDIVVMSTVLFIVVVPILMTIIQYI